MCVCVCLCFPLDVLSLDGVPCLAFALLLLLLLLFSLCVSPFGSSTAFLLSRDSPFQQFHVPLPFPLSASPQTRRQRNDLRQTWTGKRGKGE